MDVLSELHFCHAIKDALICPSSDLVLVMNEAKVLTLHRFDGKAIWHYRFPEAQDYSPLWSADGTTP